MSAAPDHILYMTNSQTKFDIVILGLGITGISCAGFYSGRGKSVALADSRTNPPGLAAARKRFPDMPLYLGEFDRQLLCSAATLVVSPGISVMQPAIQAAHRAGVRVIGDIELFCQNTTRPIVAVTGSNGKSTVASLVSKMIERAGKQVKLGGNIGLPALELLSGPEPDFYVLELSSFQLETTSSLNAVAAAVLNLSEDHMDRYTGMEQYANAKARIYNGSGTMIINQDDAMASAMARSGRSYICYTSREPAADAFGIRLQAGVRFIAYGEKLVCPVSDLPLQGSHNTANAMAALALGTAIGLPMDSMVAALRDFKGLPHRCQWVARINGADWINDSKGTNVGASCAAIEGLAGSNNLILIAGGDGKGADFSRLAEVAAGRVREAILIGRDANRMAAVLRDVTRVNFAGDMDAAVALAFAGAAAGDVVLLSPACASLDMFTDYQQRGNEFVAALNRIARA